jgi:hypothetical protein
LPSVTTFYGSALSSRRTIIFEFSIKKYFFTQSIVAHRMRELEEVSFGDVFCRFGACGGLAEPAIIDSLRILMPVVFR